MTIVQFYQCKFLTEVPDFSSIPNLEELTLHNCKSLVEVHDSVGFLDKLVFLSLQGCSNLTSLPRSLKLRSLKWLDLGGCSSLENFPEIECKMERLRCIILEHCGIKELPSSIGYLVGLHYLYLEGCKNLVDLPSSILQLRHLESLSIHCSEPPPAPVDSSILNDGCFPEMVLALEILKARNCVIPRSDFLMRLHCFSKLEELDLSGSDIVSLPTCIKRLVGLISLHLDYCKKLKEILELPQNIRKVYACRCISLQRFAEISRRFHFNARGVRVLGWIDLSGCYELLVTRDTLPNPSMYGVCLSFSFSP